MKMEPRDMSTLTEKTNQLIVDVGKNLKEKA